MAASLAGPIARKRCHALSVFFLRQILRQIGSTESWLPIVGHSSLDIILTYYHVSEDELLRAVDSVDFEAVLGGKRDEK